MSIFNYCLHYEYRLPLVQPVKTKHRKRIPHEKQGRIIHNIPKTQNTRSPKTLRIPSKHSYSLGRSSPSNPSIYHLVPSKVADGLDDEEEENARRDAPHGEDPS